jgi:anti-anti-sigma factor
MTVVGPQSPSGPGEGGERTAETPPFAVDWQVRPPSAEAQAVDQGDAPRIPAAGRRRGLTFDIARVLGTVVVSAQGCLDEVGAQALSHVLDDLIENQGNMAVVVDLDGVTDVDHRCLDIFVTAQHWAVIRGGRLSLTGARRGVARALEVTGVDRLVQVTSDRMLAVPAPPAGDRGAGPRPSGRC